MPEDNEVVIWSWKWTPKTLWGKVIGTVLFGLLFLSMCVLPCLIPWLMLNGGN